MSKPRNVFKRERHQQFACNDASHRTTDRACPLGRVECALAEQLGLKGANSSRSTKTGGRKAEVETEEEREMEGRKLKCLDQMITYPSVKD